MRLALVIGTVTSTAKIDAYLGEKLLLVRALDPRWAVEPQSAGSAVPHRSRPAGGNPLAAHRTAPRFSGGAQIAVDRAQAGPGDTVLILDEGNSARQMLGDATAPVRTVVVGVVDRISMAESRDNEREGE